MALQGLAHFRGVRSLLDCSFTFSQGISPSVCTMTIPPQSSGFRNQSGDLVFTYGPVRIIFRDCKIDKVESIIDAEGRQVWQVAILDRRWRWREGGQISGFYNVRRDEHHILPHTIKTPQELAKLCLEAMGERGFDVSQLPNDVFPETDWEYALPAEALARLCDQLACRIVLGLDNRVRIVRVGRGVPLRPNQLTLEGELTLDPPEPPEEIVIVGARDRWQHDFDLEPVGLDTDNRIKPIDKLSYAPRVAGRVDWRHVQDDMLNLPVRHLKARELAQQTVFKWYRIKTPFSLPGVRGQIKELDRILPLENIQIETQEVEPTGGARRNASGRREPKPPAVYGQFWGGYESLKPRTVVLEPPDKNDNWAGVYARGFVVDQENGIVKFSEMVTLREYVVSATGNLVEPAKIRLRIACGLRDEKTRAWSRTEYKRRSRGRRRVAKHVKYVMQEDIVRERYMQYRQPAGLKDNHRETTRMAAHYLNAEERKYQTGQAGSMTQAGLFPINLDGAITQVSWLITGDGFCFTRVSRNREELLVTPSYDERRLFERIGRALAEQNKAARHRRDDEERRRG